MNKTAVLAGVSATLGVLLVNQVANTVYYWKRNQELEAENVKLNKNLEYKHLLYKITVEEFNFAFRNLDQWKQEELKVIFDANEAYINLVRSAITGVSSQEIQAL